MLGHYISPKLTTSATTRHTQQVRIEKLIKIDGKKFSQMPVINYLAVL